MTIEPFPGEPLPENDDPYAGTGLPELGFRNYWYPVMAAWRLGRKPRAVKVLGEDIVVFRDQGKLFALAERCPHRGARLSQGRCLYPRQRHDQLPLSRLDLLGRDRALRRQTDGRPRRADVAPGRG